MGDGAGGGNGFGDLNNYGIYSMAVFGSYLYVGTHNDDMFNPTGCEVWRSSDGTSWNQVNTDGFGDAKNRSASSMAVFGNYLYIGTRNVVDGCEVWRSSNGTSWTPVNTDGFGDAGNRGALSMAVLGSYLYVGTYNPNDGCEVWRFQEVESIPTLSEWGLIIFITILLGTGVMILRKRRMA